MPKTKGLKSIETISSTRAIVMYIIVSFFLFFEMAVQVSPSVMAPQLMQDLNIGAFGLGLMSGFYFYTYTAMQIPSGLLFDRFNPGNIIAISIIFCAVGSLAFGFAGNLVSGAVARMLMGLGSAFAFVSVLVITADLFPSRYFATITGITQMLAAFGAMSGQLPISALVSHIGWRQTMVLLAIVGGVLSIVVWRLLRYERHVNDVLSEGYYDHVKRKMHSIIMSRQTWYIAVYACLLWAPMSGFASLWGVPFLMRLDNLDEHTAALICSMMWLGLALASPLLGMFSTAISNRVLPLALSALIGVVSFALVLFFSLPKLLLATLLFLAGAACAGQALSFTVVKENHSAAIRATAIAFNNMAVVVSGALFQPLIGWLIQSHGSSSDNYLVTDYQRGLIAILIAYIVGLIVATFFIREKKAATK